MPFDTTGFVDLKALEDELRVLDAARKWLPSPRRWCKRNFVSEDQSRVCILGALDRVTPRYDFRGSLQIQMSLVKYLPDKFAVQGLAGIASFNDHWTTRHKDVLAVLDRAIVDVRARLGLTMEGQ